MTLCQGAAAKSTFWFWATTLWLRMVFLLSKQKCVKRQRLHHQLVRGQLRAKWIDVRWSDAFQDRDCSSFVKRSQDNAAFTLLSVDQWRGGTSRPQTTSCSTITPLGVADGNKQWAYLVPVFQSSSNSSSSPQRKVCMTTNGMYGLRPKPVSPEVPPVSHCNAGHHHQGPSWDQVQRLQPSKAVRWNTPASTIQHRLSQETVARISVQKSVA